VARLCSLTMFTLHSCFFRNHQQRASFASLVCCFRQRIARKRKSLWETEKPGAGSQPRRRSILGSLEGRFEGRSPAGVAALGLRRSAPPTSGNVSLHHSSLGAEPRGLAPEFQKEDWD
ncbi:hypothetical protein J0S82_003134, partial [Galemys pyrenaicus]